jgi:ABC-type transporter Mla subunit MlaD
MTIEARVGVFVIVSLLVLGATVYFVRTTQEVRGQVVHTTGLSEAGGLASGTPVLFAGIRVGQVVSVRPSPADPTRIEVTFAVKAGTPVNEQSIARVGHVSLMGGPALFLTSGSNNARRLAQGEVVRSGSRRWTKLAASRRCARSQRSCWILEQNPWCGVERPQNALRSQGAT